VDKKLPAEAAMEAGRQAALATGGMPRAIEKAKTVAELTRSFYGAD
jgi:hypothetical protein